MNCISRPRIIKIIKECSKLCHETHQSDKNYNIYKSYCGKYNIVSFRGTRTKQDWVYNLDIRESSNGFHNGFMTKFEEIKEQLNIDLENTSPKDLIFTGYSRGGALATLACMEYPEYSKFCITFASPHYCSKEYADNFMEQFPESYRCILQEDPILYATNKYHHIGHNVLITENLIELFMYPEYPEATNTIDINKHCINKYTSILNNFQDDL